MHFTPVTGVEEYEVLERGVRCLCGVGTEESETDRTIPIILEFLRPDCFRMCMAVNPEVDQGGSSLDLDVDGIRTSVDPTVSETDEHVVVRTAELVVHLGRDGWSLHIESRDGTDLLRETATDIGPREGESRGLSMAETTGGSESVTDVGTCISLRHDDHLYGFGEKFTSLDKRGQSIESWIVRPDGIDTEQSYKNVPFFLSTRGYGLFVNTTRRVTFDVGSSTTEAMSVDVEGDALDFFFFYGPSIPEIVERYTALTGRSRIPPKWSFGLWMSRASYENREQVEEVADRLREEEIPCDVLHLDPTWMGGERSTDLEWDREAYPEPESMIAGLHEDGFHVSLWEHPYLAVDTDAFDEAAERGYLVRDGGGKPYVLDDLVLGQDRGGIVDFTNPEAVSWWQDKHRPLVEMGVDAFKTDFGEEVPRDAVLGDGRGGSVVHNQYPNLYKQTVDEVLVEEQGRHNGVTWGRAAWTGGQRYPVFWGGNPPCTFDGMAAALRGGLSASLSGFPFWSHDVGGFWGEPSTELYVRWAQFGLLSSHVRCHGIMPREPWEFGEEATRIVRKFAELRYRLLPYIYALAAVAARTGDPVVRPLVFEYQHDPVAADVDDQYLLGPDVLVSPVMNAEGHVDVYLPEVEWVDYWSGERFGGGRTLHRDVPLDTMPLFVRAGSVIPHGEVSQTIPSQSDEVTLHVELAEEGAATAEGVIYDELADEVRTVTVSRDEAHSSLEFTMPDLGEYSLGGATVRGVESSPDQVVVNDRTLDELVDDSEGEGWTVNPASGELSVRL